MGLSYHEEFKNIKKNSIVLEKEENIEIRKTSTGISQTKKTFIRKRLLCPPEDAITCKSWARKNSIDEMVSKGNKQRKKLFQDHSSKQSSNIIFVPKETKEQPNKHVPPPDMAKLERKPSFLLRLGKDKKSHKNNTNKHIKKSKESCETWGQHLSGNCDQEVAKEKCSLKHQFVSNSPYYNDDRAYVPKPLKRSVGSQEAAEGHKESCWQKTAKCNEDEKNVKHTMKKYIKTNPPSATISQYSGNCCYGFMQHSVCPFTQPLKGVICRHHNFRQVPVTVSCEHTFCHNDYYFDCTDCSVVCSGNCKSDTAKRYRRQNTDLETQHFYIHPGTESKSKSKNICNKNHPSPDLKEFIESKKKECDQQRKNSEKQMKKLGLGKTKDTMEGSQFKPEKFHKILSESEAAELVECFDRYIDEREKELNCKSQQSCSDHNSTTTTEIVHRKQKTPSDAFVPKLDDESSLASHEYSVKTLQTLKQMKIHEYKPQKPFNKIQDDKKPSKFKNYQQYIRKFSLEDEQMEKSVTADSVKKPSSKKWSEVLGETSMKNTFHTQAYCLQMEKFPYDEDKPATSKTSKSLKEGHTSPEENLNEQLEHQQKFKETQTELLRSQYYENNKQKKPDSMKTIQTRTLIERNLATTNVREESFASQALTCDSNSKDGRQSSLRDYAKCVEPEAPESPNRKTEDKSKILKNTEDTAQHSVEDKKGNCFKDQHNYFNLQSLKEPKQEQNLLYNISRESRFKEIHECDASQDPKGKLCQEILTQYSIEDQKESGFKELHEHYNFRSPKKRKQEHEISKESRKDLQDTLRQEMVGKHSVEDKKPLSFKGQHDYNFTCPKEQGQNLLYENSRGRIFQDDYAHKIEFSKCQDHKDLSTESSCKKASDDQTLRKEFEDQPYTNLKEIPSCEHGGQHQILALSQREKVFSEEKNLYDSARVSDDYRRSQEFDTHCENRMQREFPNEKPKQKSTPNEHGQYLNNSARAKLNDLKKSDLDRQACSQCHMMQYLITDGIRQASLTDHRTPSEYKPSSVQILESLKHKLLSELLKHGRFSIENERVIKHDEDRDTESVKQPKDERFREVNQEQYDVYDFPRQKNLNESQNRCHSNSMQSFRAGRFIDHQDDPQNPRYNESSAKKPNQRITFRPAHHYERPKETNNIADQTDKNENYWETDKRCDNLYEIMKLSQVKCEDLKETLYQKGGEPKMVAKVSELAERRAEVVSIGGPQQFKEVKSRYDHCIAEFKAINLMEEFNKYGLNKNEEGFNCFQSSSRQKATTAESSKPNQICEEPRLYDYKNSSQQYESEKEEDVLDLLRHFYSEKDVQEFMQHLTKEDRDPDHSSKQTQLSIDQGPKETNSRLEKNPNYIEKYSGELKSEEEQKPLQSLDLEWLTDLETFLKSSSQNYCTQECSSKVKNRSECGAEQVQMNVPLQTKKRHFESVDEVAKTTQIQDQLPAKHFHETLQQNFLKFKLQQKFNQKTCNVPELFTKRNDKSGDSLKATQKDKIEMLTRPADQNSVDKVIKQDCHYDDTSKEANKNCSIENALVECNRMMKTCQLLRQNVSQRSTYSINNLTNENNEQISIEPLAEVTEIKEEIPALDHKPKDVLNNFKNCLETVSQTNMVENKCIALGTRDTEDSINKLSSCRSLALNQNQSQKENLTNANHYCEDRLVNPTEQKDQFKDFDSSSPDSSGSKLKATANHECHSSSSIQNTEKQLAALNRNEDHNSNEKYVVEITTTNLRENILSKEFVFAEGSQPLKFRRNAKQWEIKAIHQRDQTIHKISSSLLPLDDNAATMPEDSSSNLVLHLEIPSPNLRKGLPENQESRGDAKQASQVHQECLTAPSLEIPNFSGIKRENASHYEFCSSTDVQQPAFDSLKSILKSCRSEAEFYDVPTCKTSSVVSSSEENQRFGMQALHTSSRIDNAEQEKGDPQINKEIPITKKNSSPCPMAIQNNLECSESHANSDEHHHRAVCHDCQLESETEELESYSSHEYDDDSITCAKQMPAFNQCLCMWDTYVEMMMNYYNGKRRH